GPRGAPARHEPAGPLSPDGKTRYQGIPRPLGPTDPPPPMKRWSMAGWATLWLAVIALLTLTAYGVADHYFDSPWLAALAVALLVAPFVAWAGTPIELGQAAC